jgi:hypothetical protein
MSNFCRQEYIKWKKRKVEEGRQWRREVFCIVILGIACMIIGGLLTGSIH